MVNASDVIKRLSLKPQNLKLEKTDTTKLNDIVEDIISECEDWIKTYTNNSFGEGFPKAVELICFRAVSNMITFMIQRRDSPIIKVNDWNIQTVSSNVFTSDIKEDLEPYMIEKPSQVSDKIDFFAITGGD